MGLGVMHRDELVVLDVRLIKELVIFLIAFEQRGPGGLDMWDSINAMGRVEVVANDVEAEVAGTPLHFLLFTAVEASDVRVEVGRLDLLPLAVDGFGNGELEMSL